MRLGRLALWTAIAGVLTSAGVSRAAILTGSVSFNPATSLYTYAYTVNNTSGLLSVNEISVLIDSLHQDFTSRTIVPVTHTEPSGTTFDVAFSGSSAQPPLNEFGTFWQWQTSVPIGSIVSGYSFSTPREPVAGSANNYFLYGTPSSGTIIEYGHIVAPDLGIAPEPGTCVLLLLAVPVMLRLRKLHSR